jgi:hypothetical protein
MESGECSTFVSHELVQGFLASYEVLLSLFELYEVTRLNGEIKTFLLFISVFEEEFDISIDTNKFLSSLR